MEVANCVGNILLQQPWYLHNSSNMQLSSPKLPRADEGTIREVWLELLGASYHVCAYKAAVLKFSKIRPDSFCTSGATYAQPMCNNCASVSITACHCVPFLTVQTPVEHNGAYWHAYDAHALRTVSARHAVASSGPSPWFPFSYLLIL